MFDFPVVDAHVHLYPDALAPKVTPALSAKFGNTPAFDGTVQGCRQADLEGGVSISLNVPVATNPHQVAHTNAWAKEINAAFWGHEPRSTNHEPRITNHEPRSTNYEPRILSLAALHPLTEDKPAVLAQIAADGFAGVKFHPEYQQFRFNDANMDDCWAAMSELGLVAFLHAGGERVFKPPFHSSPSEIRELHRRFPKLKISAAHLGGFGMWDEAEKTLVGEDVWLDLSHTFFWMDEAQILRMIHNHGARRILFGTDTPWQDPGKVLRALQRLPLAKDEFEQICWTNARDLFRI